MSLVCPVCKASNENGPQCRRCRADLSMLFAVRAQARRHLNLAVRHLRIRDWAQAETYLQEAETMHTTAETAKVRSLLALIQRDFDAAWHAYQSAACSWTSATS